MVDLLIALLAASVISIILLVVAFIGERHERKALLDRLLVANQIMPIMKDPEPAVKKAATIPQRVKFKLWP